MGRTPTQGVCRRHLHHFALPTFQVMQMPENFAQLVDNGTRGDQKQLPGLGQFDSVRERFTKVRPKAASRLRIRRRNAVS